MDDAAQAERARHDLRRGAGLGTITPGPASWRRGTASSSGWTAGLVCFWALHLAEASFNYDDSLDVFGVHGIGGMTGTCSPGCLRPRDWRTSGLIEGNPQQLLIQLYGVAVTLVWSTGATFVLLKLVGAFVPLRVSREHELEGLDITQHGEALQ